MRFGIRTRTALIAGSLIAATVAVSVTGTAAAASHGPVGKLDKLTVTADTWTVTGWAVDANNPASTVLVDVYLDGKYVTEVSANGTRADLPAAYGTAHGFSAAVAAPTAVGMHWACAYSINPTGGTNPLLGCQKRTVAAPATTAVPTTTTAAITPTRLAGLVNPLVKSDAGATWTLTGWVVNYSDPATAVAVHFYLDNTFIGAGTASGTGHAYSFSFTAPTAAGTHYACVYAINPTGGTNPLLGCRRVTV